MKCVIKCFELVLNAYKISSKSEEPLIDIYFTFNFFIIIKVTPCTGPPCLNSGTCTINGADYSCACPFGISGTNCEVTPCSSSPCLHGGSCNINGAAYTCSCADGYSGANCEGKCHLFLYVI